MNMSPMAGALPAGRRLAATVQPAPAPVPAPSPAPSAAAPAAPNLEGLSAAAYAALARSYREQGQADLADRYTLAAVKGAKDGPEAWAFATQRFGPDADASVLRNKPLRSQAHYVASAAVQAEAAKLIAPRFTDFEQANWALSGHPASSAEANVTILTRVVALAADRHQVQGLKQLARLLDAPGAMEAVEAGIASKPKPSIWTLFSRFLQAL